MVVGNHPRFQHNQNLENHKMKKTLTNLTAGLLMAGAAQAATTVTFTDLGASLTDAANTLTADGSGSAAVTGASNGANPDFLYSVAYTGFDFDGDMTNDTFSFDVRVSSRDGGTVVQNGLGMSSAVIGSTVFDTIILDSADAGSPDMWVPGAADSNRFGANETLVFTIENVAFSGNTSPLAANFLGFSGALLTERGGDTHSFVMGEGTGLNGYSFDGVSQEAIIAGSAVQTLNISSFSFGGSGNFGVNNVDFGFEVDVVPEPSSSAMLLGGIGVLTLLRRRK